MSEKPEALRYAYILQSNAKRDNAPDDDWRYMVAAELLRQHAKNNRLKAENERLKAKNERLREALGKYGRHLDDCALTLGGYQCTCGFNQQEVPR